MGTSGPLCALSRARRHHVRGIVAAWPYRLGERYNRMALARTRPYSRSPARLTRHCLLPPSCPDLCTCNQRLPAQRSGRVLQPHTQRRVQYGYRPTRVPWLPAMALRVKRCLYTGRACKPLVGQGCPRRLLEDIDPSDHHLPRFRAASGRPCGDHTRWRRGVQRQGVSRIGCP